MPDFDVLVLGGGSAGFAAARAAAGLGARVGLIERRPVGGLCILDGCIPSKALTTTGDLLHRMRSARDLGLHAAGVTASFAEIMERKRRLVREFATSRSDLIGRTDRVELLLGKARFTGPREIALQPTREDGSLAAGAAERRLTAGRIVLATGSYAWLPPIPGLRDAGCVTSDAALDLDVAPDSMVILGAGLIALELGQFYARMGTRVTMLQRGERVLTREDSEVGETIAALLGEEGIQFHTRVTVHSCSRAAGGTRVVRAEAAGEAQEFRGETLLVALGRRAQVHGLALDVAGIRLDEEECYVTVDDAMRTSSPDVFAAGDVAMRHQMTHLAVLHGEVAGANAARSLGFSDGAPPTIPVAGEDGLHRLDDTLTPYVIFCDPPFARVGLNEREAAERDLDFETARSDFSDQAMPELMGQTRGFVKLLAAREDGKLLGVQVLGHQADTLIHEATVAMTFGATVEQLVRIPHFHPTLSEILPACAERLLGGPLRS